MWHTIFIAVHAVAGVVAFVTGCVALRRGAVFEGYFWSLVVMAFFLAVAVVVEWGDLDNPARVLFAAFVLLAGYLVWRAVQARRTRPDGAGPSARYIDHLGFTLVALFDAFVVIGVLDLGVPAWLCAVVGVAVAVAGHYVLRALKVRLAAV